jgi:all-trans-retinol 13,14-reductase
MRALATGGTGACDDDAWDAIVVGAGIGGLVCAGYLAAAGRRVLVAEQHDVAGGNGHVFRRRGTYQFDVGTHYIGDCGPDGILPAIMNGLGLRDRVSYVEMDPDGFDRIIMPGLSFDVPTGWPRYRQRLIDAFPQDATGLAAFTRICAAIAGAGRNRMLSPDGTGLAATDYEFRDLAWGGRSLAALFDDCGLSRRARTVLAAQSLNYGAAPGNVAVMTHAAVTDHYLRGAYYPAGGGQTMVAALVDVIEAHGGQVRTRCLVRRILVHEGGACGVELADGRRQRAPVVISNADYRRTILELCGDAEGLPARLVKRAGASTMRVSLAALYLGLDIELPDLPSANIWWLSTDDIDEVYERLNAGLDESPSCLYFSFASAKEGDGGIACPPGHTNLQVITSLGPGYGPLAGAPDAAAQPGYRRDPAYQAAKERLTEQLLTAAEQVLGPLREHVKHVEMATALTHERYTRSSGGTPYGLATWGPPGGRLDHRPDVSTGVPGLYTVGQSTRFGSGITGVAISGIMCASRILGRALLSAVHSGEVLADPALLPQRPAGWDPLAVSRGRARSAARGLAPLRGLRHVPSPPSPRARPAASG